MSKAVYVKFSPPTTSYMVHSLLFDTVVAKVTIFMKRLKSTTKPATSSIPDLIERPVVSR